MGLIEIIAIIFIILWIVGLITSFTVGGFIHILIVIAVVVFLLRIFRKRPLI